MADRQIGSLPKATEMDEESLLVVEQQNTAKSITGELVAQYAREATEGYANDAKASADKAKQEADRAKGYADTIEIDYDYIEEARTDAQTSATEAAGSAAAALKSQQAASQSEKNAASSETKAKASQDAALASQTAADLSEMAAKASQEAASASEGKAAKSADAAQASQEAAAKSAETAKQYSGKPPEIDEDGFWETWDADAQKYTSTGEKAVNHWDKTYKTVEEMQADSSQPKNTVCIISSDVEQEENARVYMWDGAKWNFLCDLSGLQGVGIAKIELTNGNHAPGTDDTYTITLTDRREYTFTVHNGSESPVLSVNGHEGEVQLAAEDVGALPADGTAKTAEKLAAPRSLKTDLGSTTAVTFDGSADQNSIPVTGTLPVGNGGTGKTTAPEALTALGGVPTTRTVNGKALSTNITLSAADVNAVPVTGGTFTGSVYVDSTGESDVGVAFSGGMLYLFGMKSSAKRGLYDNKKNKFVIEIDDNITAHFLGTADQLGGHPASHFLRTDVTAPPSDDTVASWQSIGACIVFVSQTQASLMGLPSTYGILMSMIPVVHQYDFIQVFVEMFNEGRMWTRCGSGGKWARNWTQV